MMNERFFIFDCNDRIVGNPKGYRTIRGAVRQQNLAGSPAYRAIWAAYDERKKQNPMHSFVSAVRAMGDA